MAALSVLVVDDDPDMVETLRSLLERTADVNVSSAATLEDAMARLQSPDPLHLVICDLRLGAADGVDFLRECRRLRPKVRRLLLTGFSQSNWEETGVRPDDADWMWEKDDLVSGWSDLEVTLKELMQDA